MMAMIARRGAAFGLAAEELLSRDAPGGLAAPGAASANGRCRLLATRDGWVALNLARREDWDVVPALTGGDDATWASVERAASSMTCAAFRDHAIALQLPSAVVGEASPRKLGSVDRQATPRRVVDLSALWAGPLCAALLHRAGADVLRIDSVSRPDPTPRSSPLLDAQINGGKRRLSLDLREADDRRRLHAEIEAADVLVTSARPAALARLGIDQDRYPALTWVAVTGHGSTGAGAGRVGFGDDCAAAGGLLDWIDGAPVFRGDALADPLTGLEGAMAVLGGATGFIDMAMAGVAAAYARAPSCA